jgi:hypothetical protein
VRPENWWRGPWRVPLALLAALTVTIAAFASRPVAPGWTHTYDSPEALARAVLDALARSDRPALASMAITEAEFRTRVWPALPASRPERNIPLSYAWTDLRQKSHAHLAQTVAQHAGRRYTLVSVRFRGETTAYGSFSVSRKAELTVVDADGVERSLRVFGSVLAESGRYKLFSFAVD